MYRVRKQVRIVYGYLAAVLLLSLFLTTITHARQPYLRTYGNDVIAAGEYGSGCSSDATATVRGFGQRQNPGAISHNNYVGAGAELGVFAPAQITGFLPGAVNTGRTALDELSFANNVSGFPTTGTPSNPDIGGGYGGVHCIENVPDPRTEPNNWYIFDPGNVFTFTPDPMNPSPHDSYTNQTTTIGALASAGETRPHDIPDHSGAAVDSTDTTSTIPVLPIDVNGDGDFSDVGVDAWLTDFVDLSDMPTGNFWIVRNFFHYGEDTIHDPANAAFNDGTTPTEIVIPRGHRMTFVIHDYSYNFGGLNGAGNHAINANIRYEGWNTGWTDASDIPLLRTYVGDNLKFDHSVRVATGLFYSGFNVGNLPSRGHTWTCTKGSEIIGSSIDVSNPGGSPPYSVVPGILPSTELAQLCNNPLTIHGALVANRIFFYRTNGDVATAVASNLVGEDYDDPSDNRAETIVFSPEVYQALLDEADPPTVDTGAVDAVRSLPPAF